MAAKTTPLRDARGVFGTDLLAPDDVARVLSCDAKALAAAAPHLLETVPYDHATLEAAQARGEMLVFRVPSDGSAPLTVLRLLERFPEVIQAKLMKGVGYLLKDEWTLEQEPFAHEATCTLGWRLVHREPIPATRNLNYDLQDEALTRYAATVGLGGMLTRRTGIEMVYDTVLMERARGLRLLERTWDWSDTRTVDGGYITAGEFGAGGLHVIGYSRAVRFGTLGICAQH